MLYRTYFPIKTRGLRGSRYTAHYPTVNMPELTIEEARAAMIAKRFGGNVNGAKTSDGARRKKKSVHKTTGGR